MSQMHVYHKKQRVSRTNKYMCKFSAGWVDFWLGDASSASCNCSFIYQSDQKAANESSFSSNFWKGELEPHFEFGNLCISGLSRLPSVPFYFRAMCDDTTAYVSIWVGILCHDCTWHRGYCTGLSGLPATLLAEYLKGFHTRNVQMSKNA